MRAEALCLEALELEQSRRAAFLDKACAGEPELRREVEELLAAHIGKTCHDTPATAAHPPVKGAQSSEWSDRTIGPYTLLDRLGEGGMGIVYLAEQSVPVRRQVALKVIKPGMDSDQVLARFAAERQALELMDHPNVARVLDAGATSAGRPYFVMELVRGFPITRYCDEARASLQQRLELFCAICAAIQHAHQKGIIHRDIKPSNILVTEIDSRPLPKVIDFGIAKAIDQQQAERTLFTQHGAIVGTPEYMSPEQAGTGPHVDTRTDVYSLGVVLYELLTGTTPLDRAILQQAALGEVLRLVREVDPPKPSTRLSESGDRLTSVAAVRRTEPAQLAKLVRGDLDWIVMKALEKDPARRYDAANTLARDIRHYLSGDPVEARPPSRTYRLKKFARKHRVTVAIASAFFGLTLLAASGVSLALVRALRAEAIARREATRASQAERVALRQRHFAVEAESQARSERNRAEKESAIARAVSDFLRNDLLAQASLVRQMQGGSVDADLKVRTLLDRAAARLPGRFADQPEVESVLRLTIGEAYRELGLYGEALPHLRRAIEIRSGPQGELPLELMPDLEALAILLLQQGEKEKAVAAYTRLYEAHRKARGDADASALRVAETIAVLSPPRQSVAWLEQVRDSRRRSLGANDPHLIGTLSLLGTARMGLGEYSAAEEAYRQALTLSERTGEAGWQRANLQSLLGASLAAQRRFDDAEPLLLRGYEGLKSHPPSIATGGRSSTEMAVRRLVELYDAWNRPQEAASWRAQQASH